MVRVLRRVKIAERTEFRSLKLCCSPKGDETKVESVEPSIVHSQVVEVHRDALYQLSMRIREQLRESMDARQMWSESSMEAIRESVDQLSTVAEQLQQARGVA